MTVIAKVADVDVEWCLSGCLYQGKSQ